MATSRDARHAGDGATAEVLAKANGKAPTGEIGSSGLRIQGGQVLEERVPELRGRRGREVLRQMADNDATVGAVLLAIELKIRNVKWTVEAADDSNEAARWRDYADSVRGDMSTTWEGTISEILSMLVFGWCFEEVVYKVRQGEQPEAPGNPNAPASSAYDDKLWGWRKLAIRAQDTLFEWDTDSAGGIQGMKQLVDGMPKTLPILKGLLFRTTTAKNSPEGRSILRNAYRAWYFKKRIEEIEGIGIERDLAGLPVGWVPPELLDDHATAEQKAVLQAVQDIVRDIKRDEQEGVVFPLEYDEQGNKRYDLTLLTTGGRRQFDTNAVIGRYSTDIAMSMLADWLRVGHERVGSRAVAQPKMDFFQAALDTWCQEIDAVFNAYAFPRLFRLNGVPRPLWPRLRHEPPDEVDLDQLANLIDKLSGAGAPLFEDLQGVELLNAILRRAGLPEMDEQARPA